MEDNPAFPTPSGAYQLPLPGPDAVYTVLPPGLIDVPGAARKYGLHPETVRYWVRNGKVPLCGRLRAPAPGGGFMVVSEEDLLAHMSSPQSRGRPRQTYPRA